MVPGMVIHRGIRLWEGLRRFGDSWWIGCSFLAYDGVLDWCSLTLGGAW